MNERIMKRVVANLERLSKTTLEYAEISDDPEVRFEGRFYETLAQRLQNVGALAGDIIPGVEQNSEFETYVGPGGYIMSYDKSRRRGRRVVQQLDLRGNLIREWPSADMAAEELGMAAGSISTCAAGRQSMCHGFQFRYKRG